MIKLEDTLASYLLSHCPARTDEALMDRFGISYNTLRRIQAGMPIRRSVAARLEQRLRSEWASTAESA